MPSTVHRLAAVLNAVVLQLPARYLTRWSALQATIRSQTTARHTASVEQPYALHQPETGRVIMADGYIQYIDNSTELLR
jgi:hypothetical protein